MVLHNKIAEGIKLQLFLSIFIKNSYENEKTEGENK